MSTFLFDEIIFGPVRSRRLGVSLGINLLPVKKKICNFNCIYCECGWTGDTEKSERLLPSRKEVYNALDERLFELKKKNNPPDVITYAGNGEPTLHPDFAGIIDDSIVLRDKYFPDTRIAVISNATTISDPVIKAALLKIDMNILKLDSAFDETIRIHNQPRMDFKAADLISNLASFNGRVIIQTLFLKGEYNGQEINNTTAKELDAWINAIVKIKPSEVMIYTISRDTPEGSGLHKVPVSELKKIAAMVESRGINTQVAG
jgi:wyosine [tRNA(Phe)-imidazoG37] synthetase (radical SAM superfamily)